MAIDLATTETVRALRGAGVEPLLLKGPATAQWLYGDEPGARGYIDTDLLVAPADWKRARATLADLGFSCDLPMTIKLPLAKRRHGESWRRADDQLLVDLHACIHLTEHLDRDRVWAVVARNPDRIELAGTDVLIPSEPIRALHVVLHVGSTDGPGTQAWVDAERALGQVRTETWVRAAGAAAELGTEREMGARLRRLPSGGALADALGLPEEPPDHAARAPARVGTSAGRSALEMLFPPADHVREGWPFARRGTPALVAAYGWRLVVTPLRPVVSWRTRHALSRIPADTEPERTTSTRR